MYAHLIGRPPLPPLRHGVPTPWHWVVYHPENLQLSGDTDIGCFTSIHAQHGVVIEDYVQIGSHCSIYSLSTISTTGSPVVGKVTIKKGAQIGSHSVIMPGVSIGEESIVGAHSLVLNDIPPRCLAFGIPAKVIRRL